MGAIVRITIELGVLGCEQGLRRMLLFGFQADARTLQEVPAVSQVLLDLGHVLRGANASQNACQSALLSAVGLHPQDMSKSELHQRRAFQRTLAPAVAGVVRRASSQCVAESP